MTPTEALIDSMELEKELTNQINCVLDELNGCRAERSHCPMKLVLDIVPGTLEYNEVNN